MIVNLEGKPLAIKEKKMKAKKAFLIFALLFLMVGMVGTLGVSAKKETLKIDVCHATSSATNPYVLVNVSINSVETAQNVGGHGSHAEDAWEPYTYDGVDYPGQGDMSNCDDLPIDILGCMDPLATNYDPLATIDDGSCEYPEKPEKPAGSPPAGAGELELFGAMQLLGYGGFLTMLSLAAWPRSKNN